MLTCQQILSRLPLLLAVAGCASGSYIPYDGQGSGNRLPPTTFLQVSSRMEPTQGPESISLVKAGVRGSYDVFRLETISQGVNRQPGNRMSGHYYRAPGGAPRPLVVLLPIWGASTYPPRVTLKRLLSSETGGDLDVLSLAGEQYLFDWVTLRKAESPEQFLSSLEDSRLAYETTIADVRRILRWAADRPQVDPRRIALVGCSMSANMAVNLMALEPRLHAAAFVMAGGCLHEAMATCPRRPARARKNMLGLTGWSLDTYTRQVEQRVAAIDPLSLAPAVDPSRVLYIDAANDACLTTAGREDLWNALGRPARLTLPQTHRKAFLTMTPLGGHQTTRRIVDFLERRLFEAPEQPSVIVAGAGSS